MKSPSQQQQQQPLSTRVADAGLVDCVYRESSYYGWPGPHAPIAFYDLADGAEQKSANCHSYHNLREASVSVRLALMFATDPTVESLVILTPYKAQVSSCR